MFDSFILAVGAVVPFLIYLSIGYLVVRFKWTDRPFLEKLNTLDRSIQGLKIWIEHAKAAGKMDEIG